MTIHAESPVDTARIVIVGSGFAGFHCAHRLSARLRRHRMSAIVTMISPIDYLLYTPLLPEVAGGVIDPRLIAIPLADTLQNVRHIRGYVDTVDIDTRTVRFRDQEGTAAQLAWDRLVLAPGSITRLFDIPGLADNARGLKSTAEALYLRDHILEQFELSRFDTDLQRAAARRTVVVVGSSYSGTELIAQLCAMAEAAAAKFGFDRGEVQLILIERSGRMMPEIGAKLAARAERVLRRRGVHIRTGVTLTRVTPEHVDLSDGTRIGTYTVAWMAGIVASPLINTLGLPTQHGRLRVNADLQIPDAPAMFAAGDAADRPTRGAPRRGAGRQCARQLGPWGAARLPPPRPGDRRRPRPGLRGGQPVQRSSVRALGQSRHPRIPPLRHPADGQPLGRRHGLPHQPDVQPAPGLTRARPNIHRSLLSQRTLRARRQPGRGRFTPTVDAQLVKGT
jgi:NADH dehydrogenase FAD-containing subunit